MLAKAVLRQRLQRRKSPHGPLFPMGPTPRIGCKPALAGWGAYIQTQGIFHETDFAGSRCGGGFCLPTVSG